MVKCVLNNKYQNDFLTTISGKVFYKKDNKLNKKQNIVDVNLNNIEEAALFEQGVLVAVEDDKPKGKPKSKPKSKSNSESKNNLDSEANDGSDVDNKN